MMIRAILFATDGSERSAAAQQTTLALAAQSRAALTALGIVDVPWITRPEPVPIGGAAYKAAGEAKQIKSAHRHLRTALQQMAAAAAEAGIAAKTAEVEGDPLEVLKAEATGHDLLVIGRGACFHPELGDGVSECVRALVRDNPRPVLAVSDMAAATERVLVAFDGSTPASRALHMLALLGLAQGGEVQVLSVDEDRDVAAGRAENAAALFRRHGQSVTAFGIGSSAHPAELILSQAALWNATMVAMGAYGHGGLRDVLFGSSTRRLLAECPAALFVQH